MTRRTSYKILEGTKEVPVRIVVRVGSHNSVYGRVSLPKSLIGKIVEVHIPAEPIAPEILGNGEMSDNKLKEIVFGQDVKQN